MSSNNGGPAVTSRFNVTALNQCKPVPITSSRALYTDSDDGLMFDIISSAALTITIPKGLIWSKGVVLMLPASGATVTIAGDGIAVLLNGALTSLTRTLSASQRLISIVPRSVSDSYDVTGQ